MKLGRMVHDRACVLMAMFSSNALRKFGNATKNGPKQICKHTSRSVTRKSATHLSRQTGRPAQSPWAT